jgi:hypothetical protein
MVHIEGEWTAPDMLILVFDGKRMLAQFFWLHSKQILELFENLHIYSILSLNNK